MKSIINHSKMKWYRPLGLIFLFLLFFQSDTTASAKSGLTVCKVLIERTTTNSIPPKDTVAKPWQLKKSAFLRKYGTDDASGSLIRYWFNKRKPLKTATIGSGTVLTLTAVPFANAVNSGSAWAFGQILLLGATVISTGVVFLISLPRFISFSRKKLFHLIEDLKKGKQLPAKYQKKMPRKFKKESRGNYTFV